MFGPNSWVALFLACGSVVSVADEGVEYLSTDAFDRIVFHFQGWGVLGIDTCVHAPDLAPLPMRIGDRVYEKGLGGHAPGRIVIELDGEYSRFLAEVGVQWQDQGACAGTVTFQVLVDGDTKFESGIRRESDPPVTVDVSCDGAQELMLVAGDAGDGFCCDCANWAEARLVRSATARGPAAPAATRVDVAPSAEVVQSDPHRTTGARASRIEEFLPDDVLLERPLRASDDGSYFLSTVHGLATVGLRWVERRWLRRVELEFPAGGVAPSPEDAHLEYWTGQSWWQGEWAHASAAIVPEGDRWAVDLDPRHEPGLQSGTWKVRWVLRAAGTTRVGPQHAYTRSTWAAADLLVRVRGASGQGTVAPYSGALVSGGADSQDHVSFDLAEPLHLTVRYSKPWFSKADRTVLHFALPAGECSVAVEDVLASGCVWVPSFGLFVATDPPAPDLDQYIAAIASKQTVLQRVRELPDQTFEGALRSVHHDVQNNGPTLLSLACENRKRVVQRDGTIELNLHSDPGDSSGASLDLRAEMQPRFGPSGVPAETRHTEGWVPAPVSEVAEDGVVYRQRTYVAPIGDNPSGTVSWTGRSVCVAEIVAENRANNPREMVVSLGFLADRTAGQPATITSDGAIAIAKVGESVLALADGRGPTPLSMTAEDGELTFRGVLPPGASGGVCVYLPTWDATAQEVSAWWADGLWRATEDYWQRTLADGMSIDVPDKLLASVIRASQAHCLIAARNEADGARIAPWIASVVYGPLESEANSIIHGMDLFGHDDFTRRSLDFFIQRYSPAGFLTTGYTIMGTGWHLWTLGEHYERARDDQWLRAVAPEVTRACEWIARQRSYTMPGGPRPPEYGLVPPGVVADWGVYAYRFFMEGQHCAGLAEASAALRDVGAPGAEGLCADAAAFREDLRRAYRWAQARTPVQPLQDGTWIPGAPGMVHCWGPIAEAYPGEDWNRTWAGDVEIGPHHLIPLGVLDPREPAADWSLERLEDYWFLLSGMGDYDEAGNRADWFGRGGFGKVQPYYGRNAEAYALRDDVKPFIRSYFNAIPSLLNLENLSFWEHFHNMGAWNKTHETGWFLVQSRMMLVQERGDELWLAPFVTDRWLEDRNVVSVRNAPTRFGRVSYRLESHVAFGHINATIDVPERRAPSAVVIRLRHPESKPMRAVTVNGAPHTDFDPKGEWVRIANPTGRVHLRADY